MNNLFPTEVKNDNNNISLSQIIISTLNKNSDEKIKINNLISRNDLTKKIITESQNRKKLSENYLDFMIKEKLNYVNVDKIIEHYDSKIEVYKKKYDENINIIKQKKEELKNIKIIIYENLIKYIDFNETKNEEEKPNDELEILKKEISSKEHEVEVYTDLYNRTYKLNINLKNKYSIEKNYCKTYDDQYDRYNNIYNNSINKIQAQENKLNLLNKYFNKYKNINNSLISEKIEILNKLKYEIALIKNKVNIFEDNLAKIQEKNICYQNLVETKKKEYDIRKNDYNSIKKFYMKEYLKMFEIYEIFKVENIRHILSQFILIKQKYKNLYTKFNKTSKDIMLLRIQLLSAEKKLNDIKKEIEQLKENNKMNKEKTYKDLVEIINMKKFDINLTNEETYNQCLNKENLIHLYLKNLVALNQKIIVSINNSINKSPLISKKQNEYENYDINLVNKLKDKNLFLFILKLFKSFSKIICDIIQNVLYNIYLIINTKEEEQLYEEENLNNEKIKIITNNSYTIKNMIKTQLKEIKDKLSVKKQIYSRNKDNLIFSLNEKNNSNLNKKLLNAFSCDNIFKQKEKQILSQKHQIISPKDLFKEYSNYNNKNNNDTFINNNSLRINKKLFIKKYANELVSEYDIEKIRQERTKRIKEASRIINNKLEEKELKNYLNKKENKEKIEKFKERIKNDKFECENEEEEKREYEKKLMLLKKEIKESKKPKIYNIKLSNPENDLIWSRYQEIRRLENSYIKHYSDYTVEQNIFNEYFYNAKKKFTDLKKRQKNMRNLNKYELNNSYSTRNLFSKKNIFANFSIILPKIKKEYI